MTDTVSMTFVWHDIPDFSLYEVNDKGQVRFKTDLTKKSLQDYKGQFIQLLSDDTDNPYYRMFQDSGQRQVTVDFNWLLKFIFNND